MTADIPILPSTATAIAMKYGAGINKEEITPAYSIKQKSIDSPRIVNAMMKLTKKVTASWIMNIFFFMCFSFIASQRST
ncbi:hypothetical protein [Pontiella sulfatireligans]|uniref:hypothetical protein n=1 Tax=Pontiella sulfatireligans TaxID=2750658 RepID=UPI00109C9C70|nr:hypothetical protein [Pontiella sulfatireligans]